MFHDTDAKGAMRFGIDADRQGNILIHVMPKRGPNHNQCDGYVRAQWKSGGERAAQHTGGRTPAVLRGSVVMDLPMLRKQGLDVSAPLAPARTTAEKLSMSLDEVIHDTHATAEAKAPPRPAPREVPAAMQPQAAGQGERQGSHQATRERVYRAFEQMGLTPETKHCRLAPSAADRDWQDQPRGRGGGHRARGGYHGGRSWRNGGAMELSAAEKVQRWISWVLKSGHRELNVSVTSDGWVFLAELAAAMGRDRPAFGFFDEEKLRQLLLGSDREGRFEVVANGGRSMLRKVAKEDRRAQVSRAAPSEAARALASRRGGVSPAHSVDSSEPRRRRRSCSRSNSSSACDADDRALAASCQRSLNVAGDIVIDASEGNRMTTDGQVPPPMPPGDYWTQFRDMENMWWYYEGPLGKWWARNEQEAPQPYIADDADFD